MKKPLTNFKNFYSMNIFYMFIFPQKSNLHLYRKLYLYFLISQQYSTEGSNNIYTPINISVKFAIVSTAVTVCNN